MDLEHSETAGQIYRLISVCCAIIQTGGSTDLHTDMRDYGPNKDLSRVLCGSAGLSINPSFITYTDLQVLQTADLLTDLRPAGLYNVHTDLGLAGLSTDLYYKAILQT